MHVEVIHVSFFVHVSGGSKQSLSLAQKLGTFPVDCEPSGLVIPASLMLKLQCTLMCFTWALGN